jgi:hypothetical protein
MLIIKNNGWSIFLSELTCQYVVREAKEGWLVLHHGCHCIEGWRTWDGGERERLWWVELWWHGDLVMEETKLRRSWVMRRVVKVEITFLQQWRVWVKLSGKGGWQQCCRFNASILSRDERWWDQTLNEDEANAVNSSYLNGKKVWYGTAAWWCWPGERRHWGGETEETTPLGLAQILLG